MADTEKEKIPKWISRPGKRKKMGKPPKSGGPVVINPEWLKENKAEGGRIGRATHGFGKAYMKGGRVK
jgi:hypothetical protein